MRGEKTVDMRPLRRAFAEMRTYGILADEDYMCCTSCGISAMQARADERPEDAQPVGFCFFHGQDTDDLIEHGRAMLAFNGFGGTDGTAVGRIIVGCLRRAGVRVKWSGDLRHRIEFRLDRRAVRSNQRSAAS